MPLSPEKNIQQQVERILPTVVKPGRYVGGELNQTVKPWESVQRMLPWSSPIFTTWVSPTWG
jgi:hypothetical protein